MPMNALYESAPEDSERTPCQWQFQNDSVYTYSPEEAASRDQSSDNEAIMATCKVNGINYRFEAVTRNKEDYKLNMLNAYTQPTETTQAYTETTAAQSETTAANAETTTTQAEPNDLEAAQENLISVLSGERTFFDHGSEKNVTLEEYCLDFEEGSGVTVEITKYTSVDLDQDEVPEIILWILVNQYSDYGTLVLRFQDNHVEGYTFWYRQLFELKQDGTFSTSGSEERGPSSLTFDEEGWHYVDIDIADQQQDLKEGVVWFDYPGEDYKNLFKRQ